VIFLRNNPNAGGGEGGDRFNPALDFGRRLKQLGVLVLNDPDGLSRAGSKMYLAGFPVELRPKTLVTRSMERVRAFLRELDGPAIIKPLAGFGGKNVFYVARGQSANLQQMISTVRRAGYVIVQEYLPAVAKGDKRVLLLGGVPLEVGGVVAAYKRMRPKDDIRNNIHIGGSRKRTDFSEAERRICDLLRPRLVADGLYFVGVDLVGDKILEINVFAPGGIANINDLYEIDAATAIIRDLERKVELRSVYPDPIPPHVFMRA
jgi:glutathione synthase